LLRNLYLNTGPQETFTHSTLRPDRPVICQSDKFEDAVEQAEARHKTVTRTANIARRDAVIEQLLLDVIRPLETPHIYIGPGWPCLPWNQLVLLDSNRQLPM
jgi:hypothetical protein